VDLSIVNELDVIAQNPALLVKHGDYFRDLFARWAPLTSPKLDDEIQRLMGSRQCTEPRSNGSVRSSDPRRPMGHSSSPSMGTRSR
jgi:hypothetical protein